MVSELLTIEATAELLGVTKQALAQWRYLGRGPAFVKLAPKTVRYSRADIDAWLAANRATQTGQAPRVSAVS